MTAAPRRPFRFGVSGRGTTQTEWREFAHRAEALGYSTLLLPDHFYRQLSPIVALAAAAQTTRSLRLGTLVLDNDFRHPAAMAKDVATLDSLSEGRLELGIGTGSMPADNEKTGIPFDAPGVRYERLTETLAILKALFGPDESVTFTGKHYQVKDLTAWPKPAQKHVPLMLGARGPRMLRLAAREADIIGIMGGGGADHAAQLQVVREAAGERFDQIEFNALYLQVQVDGQPESAAPSTLPGLVGSRDQIIEKLLADREQYLVSYVAVIGTAIDAFAPIVARLAGN